MKSSPENFDFRKREEKIAKMREQAIAEIWNAASYEGILKLCEPARRRTSSARKWPGSHRPVWIR